MLTWKLMREAAILRHQWVHAVFEGGVSSRWPAHMAVIRSFYGY
jgi:hypothetical protein